MTVAAIIPVLNEEMAIGQLVRELRETHIPAEIIVVDGGSTDATVDVAREAGAQVIHEHRGGYGRACAGGVLGTDADVLAFLDGDGADDPDALGGLVTPITAGLADLTLGSRHAREPGALPMHATLGNALAALVISAAWGQRITDLPSFKVIRRDALLRLGMTEATYGWTIEMIVKAARRGYRIQEVPIHYRRRHGGESKVSGHLGTSIRAASSILRTLARHGLGSNRGSTLLSGDSRQ